METLVVGAGTMGTWIGTVLASEFTQSAGITFADTDQERATRVADRFDGRTIAAENLSESFDVVCIAVPMSTAVETIETHAPLAEKAVFDVTGTMRAPLEAMETHAPDCQRASLHPLFAPANEPGNVPFVVSESGPLVDRLRDALADRGNDIVETTASEHDRAMETVQAKTHAAILAFALAGEDVPEGFQTPISSALTELADDVTDGTPRVYADIQAAFDGADELANAARQFADADRETFEQLYNRAGTEE